MNARFLVAKYASDLRRMEPVNIGVIVWQEGRTAARFLGEGETIPRRVRVRDKRNYRSWVQSWRLQLSQPALEMDYGAKVSRESEEYLPALCTWSKGNYLLVDGGEVFESSAKIDDVATDLYRELVLTADDGESPQSEADALKDAAKIAIESAGLFGRSDFRERDTQWYQAWDVQKYMDIDYALGPKTRPNTIFHRMVLGHQRTFLSKVFELEWLLKSRNYDRSHCGVLVLSQTGDKKQTSENKNMLENIATVVSVDDPIRARDTLSTIASRNGSE